MSIAPPADALANMFEITLSLDRDSYLALNRWRHVNAPGEEIAVAATELLCLSLADTSSIEVVAEPDPITEELVRTFNAIGTDTGASWSTSCAHP